MKNTKHTFFWFKFLTGRHAFLWYIFPAIAAIFSLYRYITLHYQHLIPSLRHSLILCFFSAFLMLFITPIIIAVARKFNFVVQPEFPKKHLVQVPLLGGVAIYFVLMAVLFFYWPWNKETLSILSGATIILILGTIDDLHPLSSYIRLGGQLLASCLVISSGLVISFLPDTLWGNFFAWGVTLIWILGIINASNFADGVDGLITGMSLIACLFFFLITLRSGQHQLMTMTSTLAGCCASFLLFNFKPAKIYLGDGGSTLLGFLLACFALYGGWSDKGPLVALGIPVLILGVLIFDMIYISLARIINKKVKNFKEWLNYRARDHFHHRLIHLGFSETMAVLFIYLLCIVLGLSALVLENTTYSYPVIVLLIQAILIFIMIIALMLVGRDIKE